jgi:hypothetical protein
MRDAADSRNVRHAAISPSRFQPRFLAAKLRAPAMDLRD